MEWREGSGPRKAIKRSSRGVEVSNRGLFLRGFTCFLNSYIWYPSNVTALNPTSARATQLQLWRDPTPHIDQPAQPAKGERCRCPTHFPPEGALKQSHCHCPRNRRQRQTLQCHHQGWWGQQKPHQERADELEIANSLAPGSKVQSPYRAPWSGTRRTWKKPSLTSSTNTIVNNAETAKRVTFHTLTFVSGP